MSNLKHLVIYRSLVLTRMIHEIYFLFSIKAVLGDLSIQDINSNYKVDNKIIENNIKFNVLDSKIFN